MSTTQRKVVDFPSSTGTSSIGAATRAPERQSISYLKMFLDAREGIVRALGEPIVTALERELVGEEGLELVVRHTRDRTRLDVRCSKPLPPHLVWAHLRYNQELNKYVARYAPRPLNYS